MKVVHLKKAEAPEDPLTLAAKEQERLISEHPTAADAYNRLMIIYRKQKLYAKELKLINTAIKVFGEAFRKRQTRYNSRVAALSKELLKATGLADKKGENLYQWGDLARWKKRKEVVQKKLKAAKKK
jgi:hypothetical protein